MTGTHSLTHGELTHSPHSSLSPSRPSPTTNNICWERASQLVQKTTTFRFPPKNETQQIQKEPPLRILPFTPLLFFHSFPSLFSKKTLIIPIHTKRYVKRVCLWYIYILSYVLYLNVSYIFGYTEIYEE